MPPPRLVLAILAVRDLPRLKAFYLRALGWTLAVDVPVYAELAGPGGMRLGLYAEAAFPGNTGEPVGFRPPGPGTSHTELYLHCDDVAAAVGEALAAGARLLSAAALRAWGDEAAYLADPEGNVLALARPPG